MTILKYKKTLTFVCAVVLTNCQTINNDNNVAHNLTRTAIADAGVNRFSVGNSDIYRSFVNAVQRPENADLLKTLENYHRYVLIKSIQFDLFKVEAGEIIEVYNNGQLKSIVYTNDWIYSYNNTLIPAKGGRKAEFYPNGDPKKIVTSDITYPGTSGNIPVSSGSELLFWKNGRYKRILSDSPVRVQVDEGVVFFDSPIYFYYEGPIAYSILNAKTDPEIWVEVARSAPVFTYEDGSPARETVSEMNDFVIEAYGKANEAYGKAKPLTDVYYFDDGTYQHFTLQSDVIMDPYVLKAGTEVNFQKNHLGEFQGKFFTPINDFTVSLWEIQIKVQGGERIYFHNGEIRRFFSLEDVIIDNRHVIQAGTEVILYPDGSLARAVPKVDGLQGAGMEQIEGSPAYYYPNQKIMFVRTKGAEGFEFDPDIIYELYYSEDNESVGAIAYIPNSRGEVERTMIEIGEGTPKEREIRMNEILEKVAEIDNMYLNWESEWPGYKIFEDFSSGELIIVE